MRPILPASHWPPPAAVSARRGFGAGARRASDVCALAPSPRRCSPRVRGVVGLGGAVADRVSGGVRVDERVLALRPYDHCVLDEESTVADRQAFEALLARAMARLLDDCQQFGAPQIQFNVRFELEAIPSFDESYPEFLSQLRASLFIPEAWLVHIRVGDAPAVYNISFSGQETEELVTCELADHLQRGVIESGLVDTAWPKCPRHLRHPLWPKLVSGVAVWQCQTDAKINTPIGARLRSQGNHRSPA
jgi:hypothetical protein